MKGDVGGKRERERKEDAEARYAHKTQPERKYTGDQPDRQGDGKREEEPDLLRQQELISKERARRRSASSNSSSSSSSGCKMGGRARQGGRVGWRTRVATQVRPLFVMRTGHRAKTATAGGTPSATCVGPPPSHTYEMPAMETTDTVARQPSHRPMTDHTHRPPPAPVACHT